MMSKNDQNLSFFLSVKEKGIGLDFFWFEKTRLAEGCLLFLPPDGGAKGMGEMIEMACFVFFEGDKITKPQRGGYRFKKKKEEP